MDSTAENEARSSTLTTCTENRGTKRPRRRKDNDRIKIDVGGRIFTTSKLTLTLSSTYFESKFKTDWNDDEEDYDDEPMFVDQNPETFAVLLDFMREGLILKSKLTRSVLLQAEFFGIEAILKSVKIAAFHCISNPTDREGVSEDEACRRFDEKYGGIAGAIQKGILPINIKSKNQIVKKEYAALYISTKKVIDASEENPDPVYCTYDTAIFAPSLTPSVILRLTFLDALNWLHQHGFATKEEGQDEKWEDTLSSGGSVYANFSFSRQAKNDNGGDNCQTCIVFDGEDSVGNKAACQEMKQFAAAISLADREARIYKHSALLDTGKKINLRVEGRNRVFQSGITKNPAQPPSVPVSPLDFLGNLGYTQEEKDYGSILHGIQCSALGIDEPSDLKLTILSRPI